MAESIVSDVAGGLISKVGSLLASEIGLWWGFKDELSKLEKTVGTIKSVLLDAEEKAVLYHNHQVKEWLGKLSEAMYDADDLLDEYAYEVLRQQVMGGSNVSKKVRVFFSSSNQFAFGLKMAHKVKALGERLDEIADSRKFHLEKRSGEERRFGSNGRETHSFPPEVVLGREHDKEEMIRILLSSESDHGNVSVVSVVGIGGMGKTTLAQMVYNDDRVGNHFELKIWLCLSDDFEVKLLVKRILESATGENENIDGMDSLRKRLHDKINGKKYLLVLDDVWNDKDVNKWSEFKDLLAGGAEGSKILITTRLGRVAKMSKSVCTHELTGLSESDSWSLFERVAFEQGKPRNTDLEAMGMEIVQKCYGVPLAIKTIAGVLGAKDSYTEWKSFKDNELSKIEPFEEDISPILMLSYNHLPSKYKPCFAFCSLFPKDFRYNVDELIQMWRAEGYVTPRNPNECLRDAGHRSFMDLYGLSFFQDVEKDDLGNIKYCKMHDLMHDLAISVAGDKFCTSYSRFGDKTQHMSLQVQPDCIMQRVSSLSRAKKMRTVLLLYRCGEYDAGFDAKFFDLRYLRVLNLSSMKIDTLSNSIYKLKHLRYLDLTKNPIEKLPNSITSLLNLEVLKLEECFELMRLPNSITKLVNLTNLDNSGCRRLSHMPKGIGKLTRLEKLSEFVIAKDHSISKHIGGLDELHSLNNLRGELKITNLRYVRDAASEFEAANLSGKDQLQRLTLHWGGDENSICSKSEEANEEMGMEALRPNPNLKKLMVFNYRGVKPPSWLPSLTHLVFVSFNHCRSMQRLPQFDQLPHLKTLYISGFIKLEGIDVENARGSSLFFPSLTHLSLKYCPNLKGFQRLPSLLAGEFPCFPCLSELEISGCPNLTYLPLFPGLQTLWSDSNGIKSLMEILKMLTNSTSSPFSTLSELQYLEISDMDDFVENEFLQYLPSLQHLKFFNCSFRTMCSDEDGDEMLWQSLKALHTVTFIRMENLVALPKVLRYVTTLRHLVILNCLSFTCIPEWMPELTALQHLSIELCPQLERCHNNSAEDWPKISHIPNIDIGWRFVQRNGYYLL